jgi:hypothetical protein
VYESGVTVTFLTAPSASETVVIIRDRSVTQDLELDENGKIPSQNLEKQLDKLATDVQRVKNKVNRAVALKEGFTASFTPDLPAVMVTDGYLKTNAAGDALEYVSQDDLINTISTGAQDFTASRALVSDASGLATASSVTSTELGYVGGVTSAIQTQLNAKAPSASPTFTGTVTVPATITGPSSVVVTLPTSTSTLATIGLNETFTGTKTFNDNGFLLQDNSDNTKKAQFELSGITTGQTRTITVADRSIAIGKFPTVQRFTSGSGTYTTPAGVTYIIVEMVGGGGGGGGSGTTSGTAATAGGDTTFGTSLLTAAGGGLGSRGGNSVAGGAATVNSPATSLVAVTGGSGQGATGHGSAVGTQSARLAGGQGGASALGGTGGGGGISNAGGNGVANTGGGGGGAGQDAVNSANCGTGGGSGAYIKALITAPDATYSYAVGAAGTGQAAGTSGFAGGNGGSGLIVVTEFYN